MSRHPKVDAYVGRSTLWPEEIAAVRPILLGCGLTEQLRWGKPCYAHDGRNILILQEMKAFLSIMFFKGALLDDPAGVLREQGENTRSARRIQLTSVTEVHALADVLPAYVDAAIAVEDAGLSVAPAPALELAEELVERLARDAELAEAFEALTPGRRREYNLYVAGAKRAATRERRVERCMPTILAGKGLRG